MDTSNMADQSESPITPLASTDVGDQIEQADQSHQTDVQEAPKLEGNNSTVLISSMDRDVFNAAKQGNLDVLKEQGKNLDKMLTATKNTVLHIYTACYRHPTYKESKDEILKSTTVDGILEMCPALLWQQNESGDTALHVAARHGLAGIVKALLLATKKNYYQGDLEQGCAIPSEDAALQEQNLIRKTNNKKDTALHEAVRFINNFDVVEMLTKTDPEFSYSANDAGETPLYLAVERGYNRCCHQILEGCKNPTYEGPNGRSALHAAVIRDDEEMTTTLLKSDRTLAKAADELGVIPLHMAANFGHFSMVKQLLECDKSTAYVADNGGRTALHFAASGGHLDIMKELLTHCPDCCELVDKKRQNVLHYAIKSSQRHVVNFVSTDRWLSNILLNAKDANGNAPIHYFAHYPKYCKDDFILDKVDIMSFNKENLNALDIILASKDNISKPLLLEFLKNTLQIRHGRPGHRIRSDNVDGNKVEEEHQGSKDSGEGIMKAKETQLVVATLIATVTFAAGFTMPGGYHSESGSDQGSPILSRNTAFKAFVITNTLAMAMSSCSVLVLLYSSIYTKRKYMIQTSETFYMVVNLTMLALIAMVMAFVAGTYAVLGGHSPGLALAALVLGCFFFYFFAHSILSLEKKILKAPHFLHHLYVGIGLVMATHFLRCIHSMLSKLPYRPKPTK